MGRVQNPAEGAFRGAGRRGRFVFLGLLEGDPGLAFYGKQERGSAQALRKNARDQREKCVFVLTKGMSIIGPRPLPVEFTPHMTERHKARYAVRPGLECPRVGDEEPEAGIDYAHARFENDVW